LGTYVKKKKKEVESAPGNLKTQIVIGPISFGKKWERSMKIFSKE